MGNSKNRGLPGYSKSLLWVFIVLFVLLFNTIHKSVQKKPFWMSIAIVCVLGWAWSALLSFLGWWEFPSESIMGIHVLPHLPLEEFIIYPLGGAFSIFLYTYPARKFPQSTRPSLYWAFLAGVTAAFAALALWKAETRPYYLHSQFVLYNGLCFALAPASVKHLKFPAVFVPVLFLGMVGFFWDYVAFQKDWWIYHAITQVRVLNIPVEDFNFYLMAPTAAVSLYVVFCRAFNLNQIPD